VPGLGARLGRGGATTFLQNLAESDCVVVMGANMAENHPVGFRFVVQAREQGATVIHVDPRFTRTSALSDLHVPLRAGSDIAFLGGLIRHVIERRRYNEEYVRHYTNAAAIVGEAFRDTEDLGGLFSGFEPEDGTYDTKSWSLEGATAGDGVAEHDPASDAEGFDARAGQADPIEDPTLAHPRCVFQVLRRHFARYTPTMVADVCGVPEESFVEVAEAICRNSTPERTTSFCYSVAWTQHTTGTQMIAACAILQLLLGNIGRPGGGIMALRGHATIQGSTDIPTLFNLLPGYLPMPSANRPHETLAGYLDDVTTPTGWWSHAPDYAVSLLKAWYGDRAQPDTEFGFGFLPRIADDYSFQQMILLMRERTMRGLLCMGQNPAVGGQNAKMARRALADLDWLVVRDPFEIETASFWKDGPEVAEGSLQAREIGTEIFLLPAALTAEKDGSYTNTQRLVQWHDRAVPPPGDARSEAWFLHDLHRRLGDLYAGASSAAARQFHALTWDYPTHADGEIDVTAVVAEINGYLVTDGALVDGYDQLRDDGSTACGCWIYSGVMPAIGWNRSRDRVADGRAALGWGFAWPANRRILYNRAAARPDGSPWSARKAWVWWDEAAGRWTGEDIPDFPDDKPPSFKPQKNARGMAAHAGDAPFLMLADGRAQLFTPTSLRDGPLPAHYEPWESPIGNALYPNQPRNPAAKTLPHPENPYQTPQDPRFPHVLTTYRLTEHHTAGGMSRFVPWLAELQPEGFAEIDPDLAVELEIDNGGWLEIATVRGAITTRALVTDRLQPLDLAGRRVHQVGLPWHFGFGGIARGAVANDLSALVEDPNSFIHEAKAFACSVRRAEPPSQRTIRD
jgi:formate dehydrogenase major subunit